MSIQDPSGQRRPRLPVWPYHLLALLALLAAGLLLGFGWPPDYPEENELIEISGKIETRVVRDDIADSSAGNLLPALSSVYFTLKDQEGEFRYPSSHPDYYLVRDHTGVAIDILVDVRADPAAGPRLIWQIKEHNPYNPTAPVTEISHAAVIHWVTRGSRNWVRVGYGLLAAAGILVLIGLAIQRWNRGRPARWS